MTLYTVQSYVDRARVLLLDQNIPFRYPDKDLVDSLNEGMFEALRLRPELFLGFFGKVFPNYGTEDMTEHVFMDPQYRTAFVYYICGMAQLRDEENTQDSRAVTFLNKFNTQMISLSPSS